MILSGYSLCTVAQNSTGTPYSMYGIGLLQDNYGPYTAMGGVSAAMRDDNNINFLNPASYTALDSNRFYIQLGINGEHVHISTHKIGTTYRVAQNAALNMALRVCPKFFASFGFNQRSDIGYNLHFYEMINGSNNEFYNQQVYGKGGLNDCYFGFAYDFGKVHIGLNMAYVFGNIEKRVTLIPAVSDSYYINARNKIAVHDAVVTAGVQYLTNLSKNSKLTVGAAFNVGSTLSAKKDFTSYKINSSTSDQQTLEDEVLHRGGISYPFRLTAGLAYDYKDKWMMACDYTFQQMSAYKEFKEDKELEDYHKVALGISLLPARYGRYWWQRNKYILGGYAVRSQIRINDRFVNTYAGTIGLQMPIYIPNRELMLGIAFDIGVRGTEANGLIREQFAKVRINIAFKEGWFMKRKID